VSQTAVARLVDCRRAPAIACGTVLAETRRGAASGWTL